MAQGLGDGQLDGNAMAVDVVTATGRWWKRNGNGDSDGWIGNGRLGNGWRKGLAMDGLTLMQWQWRAWSATWWGRGNAMAMDGLMVTAMNGSATDGSAMDGAMAWRWTAWWQRNSDGHFDNNVTLM
jgi:hypothetical protein